MASDIPLQANGDIHTCSFIKMYGTGDNLAVEATAGSTCIGISGEAAKDAPIGTNSTLAAAAGDSFEWFKEGETCLLVAGSAGFSPGDYIKATTNGAGITASTDKDQYGAVAIGTAASGEKAMVLVKSGQLSIS